MHASSKLILGLAPLFALGCSGDNGSPGAAGQGGTSVLVSTTDEGAGANCATGGLKLETGTDTNSNGVLDADEVTSTQYICSGGDGLQSLIATTPLPVDGVCVFGGLQVDHGIDDNSNGTLEAGEIDGTNNLCNACPYSPAVMVKDFTAIGTFTAAILDLDEVVVTAAAGTISVVSTTGLGIIGSTTAFIDVGETVIFTFSQPVYNLNYSVNAQGGTGNRTIEAFDASGATLGTVANTSTGTDAVSSELGDVAISSMTDTATADLHRLSRLEFTFCP